MAVPLLQYLSMICITRWTVSPQGDPNPRRLVLTEEVQQLMRRLLNEMPDSESQTNNQCLSGLNAGNIWVEVESRIPFLHGVVWTVYDANLAQMNYISLERIFRENIFNGVVPILPADFQQLLCLMRTRGHTAPYLIHHHCSLVRSIDKKELFLRLYDHWNDLVRKWPNSGPKSDYTYVMNKMVHSLPPDWVGRIQQNQYLDMFYRGSNYHQLGSHPGKEVLRFMRNTYSHSLQHAWDNTTRQQMYNQAQLVEMMETDLPLVLHSFQVALDHLRLLKDIDIETFFH